MESAQTYFGKLQEAMGGRAAGRVWGCLPPVFSLHSGGMQSSKLGAPSLHPPWSTLLGSPEFAVIPDERLKGLSVNGSKKGEEEEPCLL